MSDPGPPPADIRVGISGWRYPPWRGEFFPAGLPQRHELEYAASRLRTIEINGSFYSLQPPANWRQWRDAVPPRTSSSRSRAAGSSPT